MTDVQVAAVAYAGLTAVVVGFQIALALGAPWGVAAMGGAVVGRFPPALRGAAVVQAAILAALAGVVLSRAGLALPSWRPAADGLTWVAVGVAGLSLVLNLITRSRIDRRLWAPVAAGLLVCALWVTLKA